MTDAALNKTTAHLLSNIYEFTRSERQAIAGYLREKALGMLNSSYEDNKKKAERIILEADRFENCGCQFIKYICEKDSQSFKIKTSCHSRICPDCGKSYYGRVFKPLYSEIKKSLANKRRGWTVSLLTLTVNKARYGNRLPDRDDIKQIYRESSKFFRLFFGKYKGVWTKNGKIREDRNHWRGAGSVSVIEIGADNNNLHVHAIIYHPIIPIEKMRTAWKKITGDSFIIDIRSTQGRKTKCVVDYVLKYITKPPVTDSFSGLGEYLLMIKGSRRLRTSGVFYNQVKIARPDRQKKFCPYCGNDLTFAGVCSFDRTDPEQSKIGDLYAMLESVREKGRFITYPPWAFDLPQDSYN